MGLLRKIKSLFRRKTKNSTSSSNNGIILNKGLECAYNELSAEEKLKVANECDKLTSFDFSDIVAYTNDQDNKFNTIQEYFICSKKKSNDDNSDDMAKTINSLLLFAGECEIIKKKLEKIKRELEIKFHALDSIIEKPNYMLSGKKEKQWFQKYRSNLIECRRTTLVTITTIELEIRSVQNCVIDSSIDIKKGTQTIDNDNNLYQRTLDSLVDIIIGKNMEAKFDDLFSEIMEKTIHKVYGFNGNFSERLSHRIQTYLSKYDPVTRQKVIAYCGRLSAIDLIHSNGKLTKLCIIKYLSYQKKDIDAWRYVVNELPEDLVKELYKIIAKYLHQIKTDAFSHRNDYKAFLDEMNAIINRYENTPACEWNTNPLEVIPKYRRKIYSYTEKCGEFLTDEIKDKLLTAYLKLNWLEYIHPRCLFNEGESCDNDYPLFAELDYSFIDAKYAVFADELLQKVENKFNINLGDLKFLTKDKDYRSKFINLHVEDYQVCNYWSYLYDLLNGRTIQIYAKPTKENPIAYRSNNKSSTFHLEQDRVSLTLEDLFYYIRTINDSNVQIDFKNIQPFETSEKYCISNSFNNLMALIELKIMENQYDDRILILPKVKQDMSDDWHKCLTSPTRKYTAALACDCHMFEEFLRSSTTREKVDYLFVKENTLVMFRRAIEDYFPEYYKFIERLQNNKSVPIDGQTHAAIQLVMIWNKYFNISGNYIDYQGIKIIIVQNDTTYSELSDILNQELAKSIDEKHLEKIAQ